MTSQQPRTTAGLHAAVHTSVRTLTPHLELQGTLALVATDRTLRRLMTTARAPLDLWARPWPLAKLEQALMRFGAADGAINAATADGLVLAASKTRVGALLHVSLHQTASPLPAPIAAHRASEANRADPAPRLGSGAPRVELRSGSSGFGLLFLDVDNNNSSGRKLVTHAR